MSARSIEIPHRAAIGLHRRTRMIGWQRQERRHSRELLPPVIHLPRQLFSLQPAALQLRKVPILRAQRRQRRAAAFAERVVQSPQLGEENLHRRTVGHDVVHGDQDLVARVFDMHDFHAQQRPVREIERPFKLFRGQTLHFRVAHRRRKRAKIDLRHLEPQSRRDHLHGTLPSHAKRRPKTLVPSHDLVDALAQRRHIHRCGDAEVPRDVVREHARLKTVEEPQALLRERQRQFFRVAGGWPLPLRQRSDSLLVQQGMKQLAPSRVQQKT